MNAQLVISNQKSPYREKKNYLFKTNQNLKNILFSCKNVKICNILPNFTYEEKSYAISHVQKNFFFNKISLGIHTHRFLHIEYAFRASLITVFANLGRMFLHENSILSQSVISKRFFLSTCATKKACSHTLAYGLFCCTRAQKKPFRNHFLAKNSIFSCKR